MQPQAVPAQLRGQRVDQERHVVGDHIHDRVRAGEAVLLVVGRVHGDLRFAAPAGHGESQVSQRRAVQVGHGPIGEVAGSHPSVVAAEESQEELRLVAAEPLLCVPPQLLDDFGPLALDTVRVHGALQP